MSAWVTSQSKRENTPPNSFPFTAMLNTTKTKIKPPLTIEIKVCIHPQHYLNYFQKGYVKGKGRSEMDASPMRQRCGRWSASSGETDVPACWSRAAEGKPVPASQAATLPPSTRSCHLPAAQQASSGSPGYHRHRRQRAWRAQTRFEPTTCEGCSCFCPAVE